MRTTIGNLSDNERIALSAVSALALLILFYALGTLFIGIHGLDGLGKVFFWLIAFPRIFFDFIFPQSPDNIAEGSGVESVIASFFSVVIMYSFLIDGILKRYAFGKTRGFA